MSRQSANATKRQQRLGRERRLSIERFIRRLKRVNKIYDPTKSSQFTHKPRLNSGFKVGTINPGFASISAPAQMDFSSGSAATLRFLLDLRQEALYGNVYNVLIDVSALTEISPPAAIVLLAEIIRCAQYIGKEKRLKGNYPKGDRATQVLTDVGFFRAFNIRAPATSIPDSDRVYVKTAFGNKSDGRYTTPFLSLFERTAALTPIASKRLYGALIECMDNVKAHAYKDRPDTLPDIVGEWWLGGFADPIKHQLALVFYDQGRGIPATIKDRKAVRIKSYVNFTDSKILRRAVMLGLSSNASPRHGTGLPFLKEFVDAAPGGFLRIISGKGDFTYSRKPGAQKMVDLVYDLEGSLIVWMVQGSKSPSSGKDGRDLIEQRDVAQLRFDYER